MMYLLDTHIVLWWLNDDPRLSHEHRAIIRSGASDVRLSAVSVAEAAIKASLGKLDMPVEARQLPAVTGFAELPLTGDHAARLEQLPWHHRDPFDRMLIAQAQHEEATFVTVDKRCRLYEVAVA